MTRHDLYRWTVSVLYPNVCPGCNKIINYNDAFCDKCFSEIRRFNDTAEIENVDKFVAYCEYVRGNVARSVILQFKRKSEGNTYYAFAFCIAEALRQNGIADAFDIIVPVPVSRERFKERGYNQAELIAKELRYMLDKPCVSVLEKVRNTADQKTMKGEGRKLNVRGAYAVKDNASVEGKRLLIVDDVCTTGNTLAEIAKILKENGAKAVYAASFAKTVKRPKRQNEDRRSLDENLLRP